MKSQSTTTAKLRSRLCVIVAGAPGAGKTLLVQSLLGANSDPLHRYPTTVHDKHLTYSEIITHMSPPIQGKTPIENDRARSDPRFDDIAQQWRANAWLQQQRAIDESERDGVTRCPCNIDTMYTPMHTTTLRHQQQQQLRRRRQDPYEIRDSSSAQSIVSSINRNETPDHAAVCAEYAVERADFERDVSNTLLRRTLVHYDLHDTNGSLWARREKFNRFRSVDVLIVVYNAKSSSTIQTALKLLKSEAVANTRSVVLAEMLDPTLATNVEQSLRNYFPRVVDLTVPTDASSSSSSSSSDDASLWCKLSQNMRANNEPHRFFVRCQYSATSDVRRIHVNLQRALAVAMEPLVRERDHAQYPSLLHVPLDHWQRWRRRFWEKRRHSMDHSARENDSGDSVDSGDSGGNDDDDDDDDALWAIADNCINAIEEAEKTAAGSKPPQPPPPASSPTWCLRLYNRLRGMLSLLR